MITHTKILKNITCGLLQDDINNLIKNLYSHTPAERNYTKILDVKISCSRGFYVALIIFGQLDDN